MLPDRLFKLGATVTLTGLILVMLGFIPTLIYRDPFFLAPGIVTAISGFIVVATSMILKLWET